MNDETRYCASCDDECGTDNLVEVTTPVGDVIDVFMCDSCNEHHTD